MARLYIASWIWHDSPTEPDTGLPMQAHWCMPGSHDFDFAKHVEGVFDLRGKGQTVPGTGGYGLVAYNDAQTYRELEHDFGSDLEKTTTPSERDLIQSITGKRVDSLGLRDVLKELVTVHGKVSFDDGFRNLRISRKNGFRFGLKAFGDIWNEPFSVGHPAVQSTIDKYRQDYADWREQGVVPLSILKGYTGATMLKLFGKITSLYEGVIPTKYSSDGYTRPGTIVSEDFTNSSGGDLSASGETAHTWEKETGSALFLNATNNNLANGGGSSLPTLYRCTTAVGDDSVDCGAVITETSDFRGHGIAYRLDGVANDCYTLVARKNQFAYHTLTRYDAGTATTLANANTYQWDGTAQELIATIDGSGNHSSTHNGNSTGLTATDDTYTNLYAGLGMFGGANADGTKTWDDWFVDDGIAAGGDQEPALVGGKLVRNSLLLRHLVH